MEEKKKQPGTAISVYPAKRQIYDSVKERENNYIGIRIQQARTSRGLSRGAFAELLFNYGITVHRQGLWKWEVGGTVPNAYQLIAICHALEIEDGIEYFTGAPKRDDELNEAGMKKVAEYRKDLVATGLYKPRRMPASEVLYVEVDIGILGASAGTGDFLDEGGFEKVSFPESAVPKNADFGIRVDGNSMEPVYHDGQIVWVKRCDRLSPGDVGIFTYDGSGYIKQYSESEPEEADREAFTDSEGVIHPQPVLISYNREYAPIRISPHVPFGIVGRVLN